MPSPAINLEIAFGNVTETLAWLEFQICEIAETEERLHRLGTVFTTHPPRMLIPANANLKMRQRDTT